MNSSELLAGLDAGTLDAANFDHRSHIAVAWEALGQDDYFIASARIADGIKRLAASAGAHDKFNATITQAYLSIIAGRRARASGNSVLDFIGQNPDLLDGTFLKRTFSIERMTSPLARRVALLPDA